MKKAGRTAKKMGKTVESAALHGHVLCKTQKMKKREKNGSNTCIPPSGMLL